MYINFHTFAFRRFVAFALVVIMLAGVFAAGVTASGSKEGARPSVESLTDHVKYTITEESKDGGLAFWNSSDMAFNSIENSLLQIQTVEQNNWIEVERGRDYLTYRNTLTGEYKQVIYPGPIHTWDGSKWVSYVFENKGDYLQVKHPIASARFYSDHAEFWDENFADVRISDESWSVERLQDSSWRDVGLGDATISYEIIDANEIRVIRTSQTSAGMLKQTYTFTKGSPIKINVEFTASQDAMIRFIWEPSGVFATREVKGQVQKSPAKYNAFGVLTENARMADAWVSYLDDEDRLRVFLAWLDEVKAVNNISLMLELHPKSRGATVAFEEFDLLAGETAVLDPTVTINPSLDGDITYNWQTTEYWASTGYSWALAGELAIEIDDPKYWYRAYFRFDISSLAGKSITSAALNLYNHSFYESGGGEGACWLHHIYDIGDGLSYPDDWTKGVKRDLGVFILRNYPDNPPVGWRSRDVKDSVVDEVGAGSTHMSFRLKGNIEDYDYVSTYWGFRTMESSENKPYLEVTYTVPDFWVLVNSNVYSPLQSYLERYSQDLEAEGLDVEICSRTWGTAEDVRAFLQGASGLAGALLVGDIPIAWREAVNINAFPIDSFYTDLDGIWIDSDGDGVYDDHTGDMAPEIYIGRLKASGMSESEVSLLQNYFDKNHAYRTGTLTLPRRALVYADTVGLPADWAVEAYSSIGYIYDDRTLESDPAIQSPSHYLSRLEEGWSLVHLIQHGNYFSHNPELVWWSDIRLADPPALFYNLCSCSTARYDKPNYIGGWYLFGTYGLAVIGPTCDGGTPDDLYGWVRDKRLGEGFREYFEEQPGWDYVTILGDPTLYLPIDPDDTCDSPALYLPADGAESNDPTPVLDWYPVSDPSTPVLYEVWVDDSPDFDLYYDSGWISPDYWEVTPALGEGVWYWKVHAKDGVGNISSWSGPRSFRIDTTAPLAPTLVSPVNGAMLSTSMPTFDWSDSDDPSGVTYTLEIDDATDFSPPICQKSGLMSSEYTLTGSEALPVGTYYWRVLAVDGVGNPSYWSEIWQFTIVAEATPPTSSVDAISPYWRNQVPFTVTATASDDLSGVTNVELWYRYSPDDSTWGDWTLFGVDTNNTDGWSWSFTASDGDGYYEFYSVAMDGVGNKELGPGEKYVEDFDDAAGMIVMGGNWSYTEGTYMMSDYAGMLGTSYSIDIPETTCDEASVRFKLGDSGNWTYGGLLVRYDSATNSGILGFASSGYETGTLQLMEYVNGGYTANYHSIEYPVPLGVWRELKIVASGDEYNLYYNDTQYLTLTSTLFTSGRVGVWSFRGPAWFDDLDMISGVSEIEADAQAGVDTTTPPTPTLYLPTDGDIINDATPTFQWSSISDLSSVTYTLQYSADQSFPAGSRRAPITIAEQSGSDLTEYQVRIKVPYDSDMQSDFDDLRFTDSDGTTPLSYWIESKTDDVAATIWVKVPFIPASPSEKTIYMYYGNPSVVSASDGDGTFLFFDDFSDSFDANKWGTSISPEGSISVSDGKLTVSQNSTCSIPSETRMWTNNNYSKDTITEFKISQPDGWDGGCRQSWFGRGEDGTQGGFNRVAFWTYEDGQRGFVVYKDGSSSFSTDMTNIDPINEYIFKYVWASSSSASLYVYDTDRSALLDSRTLETNIPIVDLRVYFSTYSWIYGSVSKLVCDWTLLREYAPSEPETSLGSEEGLQDWTRTIEGLTESTYTVPGGEALPEGIYYWHVRAVDGAGNVGYWSGVWQFTVANVPQVITITTVEQLQAMNDNLSDHYVLGNDIDASATAGWNGGLGFDPIGTRIDDYFAGSFDGRGYTIYNLYINRPFANNVGLFGYIGTGSIAKNVGLVNVYVYGSFSVGGLVGYNAGTVSNSYSTGTTRGFYVGGFVGTNDGTISNSYSTCSVIGDFVAGGSAVGGFVGYNYGGTIYNSYSKGPVSGSSHIGGFAGANLGDIFDSFWDKQTSGKSTSAGGTGKTTTQMKDIRTYTDTTWSVGLTTPWDFVDNPYGDEGTEDIWNIYPAVNDGYPFFTWS